jgi:hypothetical protein
MKGVFAAEMLECSRCQGRMRISRFDGYSFYFDALGAAAILGL